MHGKGVFSWKDGRRYEGEYVNDKKEGHGKFDWPNGKSYEGEWKDGKQEGDGTLLNSKTGDQLKASWSNGQRVEKDTG